MLHYQQKLDFKHQRTETEDILIITENRQDTLSQATTVLITACYLYNTTKHSIWSAKVEQA